MVELQLRFLGRFQVTRKERLITAFESDKGRALLAYLAVEVAHPHLRSALTALLWPDYAESSARGSLRQAIYQLRQVLADEDHTPPLLLVTRQTLQLNPDAAYDCDVVTFNTLLAQSARHAHAQLAQCPACLEKLRQAVDLYQGEFLAGFAIADSEPFEVWRRIKQEQLHLQALDALATLADANEANGALEQAQHYAQRQLFLEPWREATHRQLMRVLAQRGQRAAALAQYQHCCQILRNELTVEPDSETTALYEQIRAGKLDKVTGWQGDRVTSDRVTPPTNTPVTPSPPHNLPATLTPFVGRTGELTKLLLQLQHPDCRLLTLVGPGGMGKTRLALEVARQRLGSYADGVFFVSLAPLTSVDSVAPTIATTLGLTLSGGDPQTALLEMLAAKQLLLILDNFEHLLGAAGLVADLLQRAPRVQILVTSRARLNLQGEYFVMVQPLSFSGVLTVAEATNADAVRLLVQSVQRNQVDFLLDSTNLPVVLRICQLVEGMPLGLEMAAGWVELLSLPEIVAEIEKSIDFLTVAWPNAPDRQRSMRAVFDWSWKLLNAHEQQAFRLLSIFRGGFTREAAEQVTGATLRTLSSLANKSLLYVTYPQVNLVRYQVHELLGQFAAEQLAHQPQEQVAIQAQHSTYYLTYVAAREVRLVRSESRQSATEIQTELDNIRQAWRYAARQANSGLLDKSVVGLSRYYDLVGLLNESIQVLGEAAAGLETSGSMVTTDPQAQGLGVQHAQQMRGKLLALQAAALVKQGRFDESLAVAQQAVALGALYGGVEGEIYGRVVIGQGFYRKGEYAVARECFADVLQLAARHQQQSTAEIVSDAECIAYVWLGAIEAETGNIALAKIRFDEGIALSHRHNKFHYEIRARINLADLLRRIGDYTTARHIYEESLTLTRSLGYQWGEAQTLLELGDVMRLVGEYTLARELLLKAEAQHAKSEIVLERVYCYISLARLHCYLGDHEQVRYWLDRVFHSLHLWESTWLKFNALSLRAVFAQLTGDAESARRDAQEAVHLGQQLHNPQFQAEGLLLLGHAQYTLQCFAEVEESYRAAQRLYGQIGNSAAAAEASAGLIQWALHRGDLAQAQVLAEELIPLLDGKSHVGVDEPFLVYLACYQGLTAAHDLRANRIIKQGIQVLQRYADRIADESLRRSFLENVPTHRQLQAAFCDGISAVLGAVAE
ncbi:MAG: hypothetical protein DYG89_52455 [Caldilinea sp. CFX5]|nr:hypothetical protein [Caldilinea sp. CFX5]